MNITFKFFKNIADAIKFTTSRPFTFGYVDNKLIINGEEVTTKSKLITGDKLRTLQAEEKLTPGLWYRITDYKCGTTQAETKVEEHPFDVIVMATDEKTLAHEGYACVKADDDYYTKYGANLNAWKVWFDIDADGSKYTWCDSYIVVDESSYHRYRLADTEQDGVKFYGWYSSSETSTIYTKSEKPSEDDAIYDDSFDESSEVSEVTLYDGNGVIYRMIDEWGNDCPYDFKQIQFKRKLSFENGCPELDEENGEDTWVFTFCANSKNLTTEEWSALKDGSLESPYGHESDELSSTFHHNIMKPYYIIYDSENEDNTICGRMYLNNNVFLGCWYELGSSTEPGYYYAYCCYSNTFGNDCYSNTFGNNCHSNTFGNDCYSNIFGNGCYSNTFGNYCHSNTFGNYCYSNTFGNNCSSNIFGNNCNSNTFGNNCGSNTFGNNCDFNECGKNSDAYAQYIKVGDGCTFLMIIAGTSYDNKVQNALILNGLQGTSSSKLTITFAANKSYCQVAGRNTSGTLQVWNPADNA